MQKIKKRKGFTLTELAIVIAVIAVLIAVLVPTFISLINKANESADSQLVKNLNTAVSVKEATDGIGTAGDALDAALDSGYSASNLSPTSEGNVIVYDQESNRFALLTADLSTVIYKDTATEKDDGDWEDTTTTWLFIGTSDSDVTKQSDGSYAISGSYSYILKGDGWDGATVTVTSESGIDTSLVSITKAEKMVSGGSIDAGGHASTKTAVAANTKMGGNYPLIYNIDGAYFYYGGSSKNVKIHNAVYVSFEIKDNTNTIEVADTVSYVDITKSKGTIKIDLASNSSTKLITTDGSDVATVQSSSGVSFSVSVVASEYNDTIDSSFESLYVQEGEGIIKAPTCTEGGYTTYTYVNRYTGTPVSVIGDTTSATGHNYTADVTEPTCTEGGYTTYTCSVCGNSYVADETEATGHSYTAVVTEPTCIDGGYTTYTCSVCGDSYTADETDATAANHDYGELIAETTSHYAHYQCSHCHKYFDASYNETTLDALAKSTTATTVVTDELLDIEGITSILSATIDSDGKLTVIMGQTDDDSLETVLEITSAQSFNGISVTALDVTLGGDADTPDPGVNENGHSLNTIFTISLPTTLDLNGYTLTVADTSAASSIKIKADTTIKNGTIKGNVQYSGGGVIGISDYAGDLTLTLDKVTVINTNEGSLCNALYVDLSKSSYTRTIIATDCTFTAESTLVPSSSGTNCGTALLMSGSNSTYDFTFTGCKFNSATKSPTVQLTGGTSGVITFNGCTITNTYDYSGTQTSISYFGKAVYASSYKGSAYFNNCNIIAEDYAVGFNGSSSSGALYFNQDCTITGDKYKTSSAIAYTSDDGVEYNKYKYSST